MLSDQSLKIFSRIIKLGYWLRLFPYKWNPKDSSIQVETNNLKRWRQYQLVSLAFRLGLFSTMGITMATNKGLRASDYLYGGFVGMVTCFTTTIELHHLIYTEESAQFLSSFHVFSKKLAEYHEIPTNQPDGAYILTSIICITFISLTPFTWIVANLQFYYNFPMVSLLRSESNLAWNLLMSTAWTYFAFATCFIIGFYLVYSVNYLNSLTNFMKILKVDSNTASQSELFETLILYRSHQLLHKSALFISTATNTVAVLYSSIMQVAAIYNLLRFTQPSNLLMMGGLLIITTVATKVLIDHGADYTEASMIYPKSLLRLHFKAPAAGACETVTTTSISIANGGEAADPIMNTATNEMTQNNNNDQCPRKVLNTSTHNNNNDNDWSMQIPRRLYKTCYRLEFSIGNFCYFKRSTFLTIIFDIVLQIVILMVTSYT